MSNSAENHRSETERLRLPYLVLIVSLLITFGATFVFYKNAQAKDLMRFENEVTNVRNRIEILLNTYIAVLKAGRGFVESNENLDRESFADFVRKLEINKNNGGVERIGYIKKVTPAELEDLTQKMKARSFADFKIYPDSVNQDKYALLFIEPFEKDDLQLIGFDMASEPLRYEAMERARETGEAAATGRIKLMQTAEAENSSGFLIFVPVYKNGNPQTVEERQNLLDGYVYSRFRASNFLQDIQNSISVSDIGVTIYEGEKRPEDILAQTGAGTAGENEGYQTASQIEVAGRKWIIEFQSLPPFAQKSSTGWTPLIFTSGLIFSMMFFGITYLESNARAKAEKISRALQESEREKGFLLEREQAERRRAEEASKAKDEFISIVSHELRTPLNSIAGWTKILSSESLTPIAKKQALKKIDKNLRAQTKIVEELLDFSQLVSRKSELSREKVDFSNIFEDEFAQAEAAAEESGVELVKKNNLNGQRVTGDGERLKRVIGNLLSNAIKFTPKGGTVTAAVAEKDSMIEMTVADTGQGINPELIPQIFERFKQADSSITRKYGGLGLGLAISRHIVNLHGGSIEAASPGEGKGATFTVKLPCDDSGSLREKDREI
jgi:two-component system, OmpR family, sensor kinase